MYPIPIKEYNFATLISSFKPFFSKPVFLSKVSILALSIFSLLCQNSLFEDYIPASEMAGDNGIYLYTPSKEACVIAAGLFGGSALFHIFQLFRSRAWFYTSFVVGSLMMTAGYAFRFISAKDPAELKPYIAQSLFIILPPSLYAATIYMIYGRLVVFVNATEASIIRPTLVTKVFVCGDVLAFLMQASGGGMMAQVSMADMGQKIMLFGLFVQLLFLGFFLFIALIFWKRMSKSSKQYAVPQYGKHSWDQLLKLVLGAAVIVILRCVFRVIEFAQGHSGYLVSHEIYMYIFDAAPMLCVQVMMHFVYAAKVFGVGRHSRLGKTESVIDLYSRDQAPQTRVTRRTASPPLNTSATTTPQPEVTSNDIYPTQYLSNTSTDSSLYTLSDLALLHHWTLVTSPSIVQSPSVNYIWQVAFPQFAFTDDALMERILSIAALHRAYLDPIHRHSAMLVAGQHHSRAIQGLMDSLHGDSNPNSGNAIFANAVLTSFYAFISFGPLYSDEHTVTATHTSRVLGASWIPLLRGLAPVVDRVREQVAAGPLGSLLDIHKWMELQPSLEDDDDDKCLDHTKGLWSQGSYSDEEKDTYNQTLYTLRQCNMWLKCSQSWHDDTSSRKANYGPWSGPFIWVFVTPESYFRLLEQRQVPAMVLYACFGALVHRMNHYWWMEGCGKSIVEVVDQCLGPYWNEWLKWAQRVVQSEAPT
ncbi:hypothetical protein OPT61_g6800 [Boeremia exigua]|uniref:Uncharacterized protein n=1 Tax=Boeremia exigua TaxID=749465 RepID=A0ACC2I4M8_9PLEO|nr:hypothetical protein OPT61_g6800 [Boeremia exigua]